MHVLGRTYTESFKDDITDTWNGPDLQQTRHPTGINSQCEIVLISYRIH